MENCSFFENRDSGVQLSSGASYNRIINCDSYYNADPTDYGDADGFAPKLDVGTENYFYGCRAWGNCDDGNADQLMHHHILKNCLAFNNKNKGFD